MYHSTFLVNRQMITEPSQIKASLERYVTLEDGKPFSNFQFRLEWYRIGISIPMDVYSSQKPAIQLRPECQLTSTEELEPLSRSISEIKFKLFIVPFKTASKNEDLDNDVLEKWLSKKLSKIATVKELEIGPNNRIYYKSKPTDTELQQIQSYSLRGKLSVINYDKLTELQMAPLGYYPELGCGMLVLE